MPVRGAFVDAGGYYATLFHELVHWTGDDDLTPLPFDRTERGVLLTLSQVVRRLGVSGRTLRGWVAGGRICVVRLTRRTIRVEEEELLRFIQDNRDGGPSVRKRRG